MATHLETPASPLDDGPRPEPEFIAGPAHELDTPASLPHFAELGADLSESHTRFLFRDISPPASKRPRLDPSAEETSRIKINLPNSHTTGNAKRGAPISLGSSSSPAKRGAPNAPRPAGSDMAPRHYAMHTSSSLSNSSRSFKTATMLQRHNSGPAIPTAPKAMLQRSGGEHLEKPLLSASSQSERLSSVLRSDGTTSASNSAVPVESSIHSYLPSLIGRPPVDDQASKRSASEVSSIDPPPEMCVNCRFPLSNKSTFRCDDCVRSFHTTCKMDSRVIRGKWKCARCLKRDAKRATSSTTKVAKKPEPAVPKNLGSDASKTSHGSTPCSLIADRYSYHARAQKQSVEPAKSTDKRHLSVPHRSRSSTPLGQPPNGLPATTKDVKQALPRTNVPPAGDRTAPQKDSDPSSSSCAHSAVPKQSSAKTQDPLTAKKLVAYSSSSRPSSRGQDAIATSQPNVNSLAIPLVGQPVGIAIAQVKPTNTTFLSNAGIKPKGNAFANGVQLQSKEAETSTSHHTQVEEMREETETEASMEISDVEFSEADLITSTPLPKGKTRENVTEETFTWSQNENTMDIPPTTREPASAEAGPPSTAPPARELPFSSHAPVALGTPTISEIPRSSGRIQAASQMFSATALGPITCQASLSTDIPRPTVARSAETLGSPVEDLLPDGLPTTTEAQAATTIGHGKAPASPLRFDTLAGTSIPNPPCFSTPTAASPSEMDANPRLDYLSKFKIKKRTSLDHSPVEMTKSPTQHSKPLGVPGWSRAFQQAGCEDPFKDAGSPSVKLNCCEDIYNLFGKCPWDLVSRDLRPKRFKLELLKALAGLKNVLDRFEGVEECLERLEAFIVERRMSGKAPDLGVPKLTTGDVTAFIEIMAARAVQNVAKQNATERSDLFSPSAPNRPMETVEHTASTQKVDTAFQAVNGDKMQDTATSPLITPTLKTFQNLSDQVPGTGAALPPVPAKAASPAKQPGARKAARKSAPNHRKTSMPFPNLSKDPSNAGALSTTSPPVLVTTEPRSPEAPATPSGNETPLSPSGINTAVQAHHSTGKKVPSGFERYVRKTFSNLLAGNGYEAPLPVSEVTTMALSFGPMEHYTTSQLAEQPPQVQALVAELRSMTAFRHQAKQLAQSTNSLDVEEGRSSLTSLDEQCIRKAVLCAVDMMRMRHRTRTVAAQREIARLELEIEQTSAAKDDTADITMNDAGCGNDAQLEHEADVNVAIEQSEVDSVLSDQSISQQDEGSISRANRRASCAYVEDVSDEEDNGVLNSLPPEHGSILERRASSDVSSVFSAPFVRSHTPDESLGAKAMPIEETHKEQETALSELLSEVLASRSRTQSVQADDVSQISESTSDLTELENTPEPPSHLFQADRPSGAPSLKLRFFAHENAAKTTNKDAQTTISGKPSRGFTQFSFRELILLALYEEPQRLYGRKALLPRLTSKSVVHFVLDKFPSYNDPAHQVQRDHLFNNIAAQCSTHVARGALGKEAGTHPETGKPATFYYAKTSSPKWPDLDALLDLSTRYRQHLTETFPSVMEDDQSKQIVPTKKRQLPVPETPSPKKLKLTTRQPPQAELESERSDHEVRHSLNSTTRAPRKAVRVSSDGTPKDADKTPRIPQSASRMKATSRANVENTAPQAAISSSSDRTIPDSVLEPEVLSIIAPAARASQKDEPQANIADPLDALLESSKTPSAEEQELLNLLSTMCDKEAARDASKMAEKKYEVVDFFEHWPQHHPSNILAFDAEAKVQEIRTRPNRRQMKGRPCKTATPIQVYRPYEGLSASLLPGSEPASAAASFGSGTGLRNASPNKQRNNISPRKRRAMRIDDSNIYADDIDDTALEQAASMGGHVKEARSWQEALGMPKVLEIGYLEDPLVKRDQRLVLEVPAAERGKTRNWFKAILPGD